MGDPREHARMIRTKRQLAAKDATIQYLRAEFQRIKSQQAERQHTTRTDRSEALEEQGFVILDSPKPVAPLPPPAPAVSTIRDYLRQWTPTTRRQRTRHSSSGMPSSDWDFPVSLQLQLHQARRPRDEANARLARERTRRYREVDAANARAAREMTRRWRDVNAANVRRWREVNAAYRRAYEEANAYNDIIRDIYANGMARLNEIDDRDQAQDEMSTAEAIPDSPRLELATHALTCVRIVGAAVLPTAVDLLPLISSFVISINTPIDVAVTSGSHHITSWLLANGARPTGRTVYVAVTTGSLAMVEMIFQSLDRQYSDSLPSDVFSDLSLAEWLLRTYPTYMAKETARVAATHAAYLQTHMTWYAQRVKHHCEWEEAYANECYRRKRACFAAQERATEGDGTSTST